MNSHSYVRRSLLASTALIGALAVPAQLHAQEADAEGGLEEIVVTAQKREQSLQDVPIAVTAVTQEALQANRIFSVNDLSSIAPGVTVKPSPGGSSVPVFTIRGQSSFGVVPGSDKQVSIYIDGVYISSPRGSIFELPDIQRLEVLRGPQGTLFGRNATAGAISVTTRDPTGEAHIKASATVGNRDAYRFQVTADLPQMGPFSAFGSFVRNYRHGEVRNASAGLIWNRTNSPSGFGTQISPKYLGTVDSNSYFGAVKFEPSDRFKMVYKYDRNEDSGTPDVTGFIGYSPAKVAAISPLVGNLINALYSSNNLYAAPDGKRPSVAANGFVVPRTQTVFGHSLTATWQASDDISVKNIAAYRESRVLGPTPIDGISSLNFTQQALVPFATLAAASFLAGQPGFSSLTPAQQGAAIGAAIPGFATALSPYVGGRFLVIAAQSASISKQWSDEIQANYSSDRLQATIGALWFHSKDQAGGPIGQQNTLSLTPILPSGVIPLGNEGFYRNKATSIAAYAQIEYKITPEIELVGGARITHDEKESSFRYDVSGSPRPLIVPPKFKRTKPNWMVGVNWTPNDDMLVYGKFSTSFVSGGSTAGIPYEPETVKSFELGVKADLFDKRLRTNLALFHADYNHFQQSQSTSSVGSQILANQILTQQYGPVTASELLSKISVFVGDQGKVRAKGFELEVTAAPMRGVTLGGSLSYTDISYPFVPPIIVAGNGGVYNVAGRPEWTGSAYAQFETDPFAGDMRLSVRTDAYYQSGFELSANRANDIGAFNAAAAEVGGYWTVNGRVALKHIPLAGIDGELAVWVKNLTDRKDITTALFTPFATSASYVPARTYGLDFTIEF